MENPSHLPEPIHMFVCARRDIGWGQLVTLQYRAPLVGELVPSHLRGGWSPWPAACIGWALILGTISCGPGSMNGPLNKSINPKLETENAVL